MSRWACYSSWAAPLVPSAALANLNLGGPVEISTSTMTTPLTHDCRTRSKVDGRQASRGYLPAHLSLPCFALRPALREVGAAPTTETAPVWEKGPLWRWVGCCFRCVTSSVLCWALLWGSQVARTNRLTEVGAQLVCFVWRPVRVDL